MMQISGITSGQMVQQSRPKEPTPPPGGNIENRQPPSEPMKSKSANSNLNTDLFSDETKKLSIDTYV